MIPEILAGALALAAPQAATDSQITPSQPASDPGAIVRLRAAAADLAAMPNVVLEPYPVSGRTPRAVRTSMNALRPTERADGARFDSVTRWSFGSRWRRSGSGQCLAESAEINMTITVVLPDLTSRAQLSRRDQQAWDRYFTALVGHETNHVRIASLGGSEMLAAMRAATTCDEMQAAQQSVAAAVASASREYDRMTEHGRREGAVFP